MKIRAKRSSLTFEELSAANLARQELYFHPLNAWNYTDWACAAAGELGEACNLIKKWRRGEDVSIDEIAKEIADTVIYLDLLSQRLGIDLGEAVREKFNRVSDRVGAPIKFTK